MLLATGVQTVVISLTPVVFIFQLRSQEKAVREASYQNLLGRYNDFMMAWPDSDDSLLKRLASPDVGLDGKDLASIHRLLVSCRIIEKASGSSRKDG